MSLKKIFICILIIVTVIIYVTIYFLYGSTITTDIAYNIKEGLVENVNNIQIVEYEWLDKKYKDKISKNEFKNLKTVDDYLTVFKKINSVKCLPNIFQKLPISSIDDGKKQASQIVMDSKGKKYLVIHHMDITMSLAFKPKIVNWIIDIEEVQ